MKRSRHAHRVLLDSAAAVWIVAVAAGGISMPALAQVGAQGAAEGVGRFAIVTNRVTSMKPGETVETSARVGSGIVLDEREKTGEASAAEMSFGEGATISIGARTTFAVSRQVVDEATGATASGLDVIAGKIRVFVSRFWGARPEVRVTTPTAIVGIKGSEAVIEVYEDGTTRVTFLHGTGQVKARRGGRGGWIAMEGGKQVVIPPEAVEVPALIEMPADAEDTLVAATLPFPDLPREKPRPRPGWQPAPKAPGGAPVAGLFPRVHSGPAGGVDFTQPPQTVFPDPPTCACPPPGQ